MLQVGVGNSKLQIDMALDGYTSITSIDFSEVVIEQMQQNQKQHLPQLQYAVADARYAVSLCWCHHIFTLQCFLLSCNHRNTPETMQTQHMLQFCMWFVGACLNTLTAALVLCWTRALWTQWHVAKRLLQTFITCSWRAAGKSILHRLCHCYIVTQPPLSAQMALLALQIGVCIAFWHSGL